MHILNGVYDQVKEWLGQASPIEKQQYEDALLVLATRNLDDMKRYQAQKLPGHRNRMGLILPCGLLLVWADLLDYPSRFNIIQIGRLEDWPKYWPN